MRPLSLRDGCSRRSYAETGLWSERTVIRETKSTVIRAPDTQCHQPHLGLAFAVRHDAKLGPTERTPSQTKKQTTTFSITNCVIATSGARTTTYTIARRNRPHREHRRQITSRARHGQPTRRQKSNAITIASCTARPTRNPLSLNNDFGVHRNHHTRHHRHDHRSNKYVLRTISAAPRFLPAVRPFVDF